MRPRKEIYKDLHERRLAKGHADPFYKENMKSAHKERYIKYLYCPEWAEKRRKVLERDYYCQGCLEKRATQVHHLTYDRVFDELLCDLMGLCEECHKKIHGIE